VLVASILQNGRSGVRRIARVLVTTKKETALNVFIKMNTSAAPLSMYDIVVAQVEAGLGQSLHDLVGDIRETCPALEMYYSPEDLALYASALLQVA
jgi:hypothetical protein